MEPFQGKSVEDAEEVTTVDIDEARASVIPSLSEAARHKYQVTSELLDNGQLVTGYTSALNKVVESLKSAVQASLVVTSSEGNGSSGEGPDQQSAPMFDESDSQTATPAEGAATTSIVITKQGKSVGFLLI